MKTVRIQVTQDDIDKGVRSDACLCPIARAACRTWRVPVDEVAVGLGHMQVGGWPDIALPDEASDFVEAFDAQEGVQPFEFELDVPDAMAPAEVTR